MSDEGEQPREKAAQRPSKKRRDHALGLRCLACLAGCNACTVPSGTNQEDGAGFPPGLGGSLLVDVLVDRSDAN